MQLYRAPLLLAPACFRRLRFGLLLFLLFSLFSMPLHAQSSRPTTQRIAIPSDEAAHARLDAWAFQEQAALSLYHLHRWYQAQHDPSYPTTPAFQRLQRLRSDPAFYNELKKTLTQTHNPRLRRRLQLRLHQLSPYHQRKEINPQRLTNHAREEKLLRLTYSYRATIQGKAHSFSSLRRLITHHPDRALREEAWRKTAALGDILVKHDLMKLLRMRNHYAQWLNEPTFIHHRYTRDQMIFSTTTLLYKDIERATKRAHKKAEALRSKTLGISKIMPWDRAHADQRLLHQPLDAANLFPASRALATIRKIFSDMGFSLAGLALEHPTTLSASTTLEMAIFPIAPPADIRIIAPLQEDGLDAYQALAHQIALALLPRYTASPHPEMRRLPLTFLQEGIALFLSQSLEEDGILRYLPPIPPQQAAQWRANAPLRATLRRSQLRLLLLHLRTEFDNYVNTGNPDPSEVYWRWYRRDIGDLPPQPPQAWVSLLDLIRRPTHGHHRALAAIFAAQLRQTFQKEHPHTPLLGYPRLANWLHEKLLRFGSEKPWEALILHALGSPLSSRALLQPLPSSRPTR